MVASVPDVLRLAVLPVLGWAAWRDVKIRRVPSRAWYPLVGLGALLLVWDAVGHRSLSAPGDALFFVRVGISLLLVAPIAYLFWRLGGFGGADAKALIAISVLLPTFPSYYFAGFSLPVVVTTLGVFSMTVLTNTVVVAAGYPLAILARNLADGEVTVPVALFGRRTDISALPTAHGRLFETTQGYTRNGLDIDALRMYLRWRGTSLAAVRSNPGWARDPASIGETHDPTDGAVGAVGDGGGEATPPDSDAAYDADPADPWGADAFLDSIDGTAYGTSPETLREGLAVVTERDAVWVSPGIPFIVPMFVGTLIAFVYGDVVFGVLGALGVV
ncbi:peptidase A24 [Halobellus salinus]|uniref:Peptidase A24 n=1 Tax=Halobellus salinus TaxID=931585 RepID=A0A830EUU7_9EURY|nr:A24 family peptidase [Halobellus salinus]GGJ12286.1 peptidase A24 [Halobellus salinus]SMP29091.1 preflagellin peptidase FlaK [Halobellus salinus]